MKVKAWRPLYSGFTLPSLRANGCPFIPVVFDPRSLGGKRNDELKVLVSIADYYAYAR